MRGTLLFCAVGLAFCSADVHADVLTEEVPVPGGAAAFCLALGVDAPPDRASFLTELTRVVYTAPEAATTAALLQSLARFVESAPDRRPAATPPAATDTVPVPLSTAVWSEIFKRPVTPQDILYTILSTPAAALLAHGLAALDDETLRFLIGRRALLEHLYDHDAAAFATLAGSLRIRDGRVMVPGGDDATTLWEDIVEARVGEPELFMKQLLDRGDGRIAYLYESLSQLEPRARAFGLGLWIDDGRERADRFKALLNAIERLPTSSLRNRAFRRFPIDPLLLMAQIPVNERGAPEAPGRAFWSEVLEDSSLSVQTSRTSRQRNDRPVDAAWIVEAVLRAGTDNRRDRLEQFAFGLRVFRLMNVRTELDRSEAIATVRAVPRYRLLMLTLERLGIVDPIVYAAAARHAARLSALGARDGFTALSQFQGALVMLVRLGQMNGLDVGQAEELVRSLSAVPLRDNRYAGGMARWLQHDLLPRLVVKDDDLDEALLAALSGDSGDPPRRVSWEDGVYRLDLAGTEQRRLRRALGRLGAPRVGDAVAIEGIAERLDAAGATLDDVQRSVEDLTERQRREQASAAIRELTAITNQRDVRKARSVAAALHRLADDVLGEALIGLAYAMYSGSGTALGRGNLSLRHDFGLDQASGERRIRMPWLEPFEQFQPGVPWHVTGSLLGLDLGLSALALNRISSDTLPGAPVLSAASKAVFTGTLALMNPLSLADADAAAIAEGIEAGRQRVRDLMANPEAPAGFEGLADPIGMDGWRRRAVVWALANEPENVPSFFSLSELLRLGGKAAPPARLDAWGVAASPYAGCVCTAFPEPGRAMYLTGRWPSGDLASQVVDLNLHVAAALTGLHLPAALARDVLASATQDYVDRVRPLYPDDWLTLNRAAQDISRSRIEDYLGALTANGPLVPAEAVGPEGR